MQQAPFPALPTQHAAALLQADAAPVAPNPPPTHLYHLQHAHAAGATRRDEERQQQRGLDLAASNALQGGSDGRVSSCRGCAVVRAAASVVVRVAASRRSVQKARRLASLQGTAARATQATPAKPSTVPGTAAPPPCAGTPAWHTAARCSTSVAAIKWAGGRFQGMHTALRAAVPSSMPINPDSGCHPAASNRASAAASQPAATHPTSELVYTRPRAPRLVGRATLVPKAKRQEMQRNSASRSPMPATQKGRPCMEWRVKGAALSGRAARKRDGGSHKSATGNGGRAGAAVEGAEEGPGAVGRCTQQLWAGGGFRANMAPSAGPAAPHLQDLTATPHKPAGQGMARSSHSIAEREARRSAPWSSAPPCCHPPPPAARPASSAAKHRPP